MKRLLLATLAVALPIAASNAAEVPDDIGGKELWRWLCEASGFYKIEALPNGQYQASADRPSDKAIEISVREPGEITGSFCGAHPPERVVEVTGNELAHMFVGNALTPNNMNFAG